MSQPILLSDEEEENALSTTVNISSKKQRRFELDPKPKHEVLVLLDDPTPQKPGPTSTPSFVPETPISAPSSDIAIVKCTMGTSHPQIRVSDSQDKFSGICGVISLESDNESESGSGREKWKENEKTMTNFEEAADSDWSSRFIETTSSLGNDNKMRMYENSSLHATSLQDKYTSSLGNGNIKQMSGSSSLHSTSLQDKSTTSLGNDNIMRMSGNSSLHSTSLQDKSTSSLGNDNIMQMSGNSSFHSRLLQDKSTSSLGNDNIMRMSGNSSLHSVSFQDNAPEVYDHTDKENVSTEQINSNLNQKKSVTDRPMGRKKMTKEERIQLMEEKKLKKEQEKVQKAAQKAEVAELKKLQKEMQKWEKGKFALKSVVAEIDAKVVEMGSVGGHLLTRFAEKGLTYRITSNPVERSIVWTMTVPEHISQISSNGLEIQYVLFVYEADEFCNLVRNELLLNHVSSVRSHYPSYTICYLTSRLMAYINKREQELYKNPSNNNGWRRPPVEEVIAKLTTHFSKVHSRQCIDEAELAEHVVGLTTSLASCQFRKKLTRLSVNANGSLIPKDTIDRNLIKKNLWLKALISIPKVQPRFAVAIWKKYPTMRSLLSVYMDSSKSVHEKEFLLKDLTVEGLLGEDRRLGEVCSKRVYRILMAQSGSIKTDDVENGADYFGS